MGEIIEFKQKSNKKLYIILAVLLVVTLALVYINIVHSAYRKSLNLNAASIMNLEDSGYSFGKCGNNVIVCGQDGLTAIDKNGEIVWKYASQTNEPLMSAAGNYILYADLNGNKAELVTEGKCVASFSPYEIITAKVNAAGYSALAAKQRGYKSQVIVFGPKGNRVFAWHSTKYYVIDALVAPDNKSLFVSALEFDEGEGFLSKLLYFTFSSDEPNVLSAGDDNLVASLVTSGQSVLAIGNNSIYAFNKNGKKDFSIDYAGRTLQEYAVSDGVIALGLTKTSTEGSIGGSVVEMYSENGSRKGSYNTGYEIKFLDVDGKKVLVNSADGAYILSESGRLSGTLLFENEVRDGLIFSGGKKLMLINGSNVNVYDSK
ncbi:MAG: hypothetical protein J5590_07515 [Clostridia bacterium]|nr:hypothetical protein [Clostridia bacterium]